MRSVVSRFFIVAISLIFFCAAVEADIHPVEADLRRAFPRLALESSARFDTTAAGLRAKFERDATLKVTYPHSYDEPFIVELGAQRLVLRSTNARVAPAAQSAGKLVYERAYESTDVIQVPNPSRSEELLLLHDDRAPRVYEYEIVETAGIAGAVFESGAIRFLPLSPEASLLIERPWVIDASGKRSESHAQWSFVGGGSIPRIIRLTVTDTDLTYPIVVDPSFSSVGNLSQTRSRHTATLLPNGKVFIAGGSAVGSTDLYDPTTGAISSGPAMRTVSGHTATLLPNGKVLTVGGGTATVGLANLYDPSFGVLTSGGSLPASRLLHTATLLPNGKVLIVGGFDQGGFSQTSAYLYEWSSEGGTFTPTGSLAAARHSHTATLLPNGKVLIAGGNLGGGSGGFISSAEIYDPVAGTFSATGSMARQRSSHTATLLADGKVLITGGDDLRSTVAELYDPAMGTFSATTGNMLITRWGHTATLLPNDKVLLTGGQEIGVDSNLAEIYNPATRTFTSTSTMASRRSSHTATLLPNGRILVAGGPIAGTSVELYDSSNAGTFAAAGNMGYPRAVMTATPLPNGKVLVACGSSFTPGTGTTLEIYDSVTNSFAMAGSIGNIHDTHSATLLIDGRVLIVGGSNSTGLEIFDPGNGTWAPAGYMATLRRAHSATMLHNGKVLLAGGQATPTAYTATAEVFDPVTGTLETTGNLSGPRAYHSATLLPNGKVLIAGGLTPGGATSSAELYDPATGVFSPAGNMTAIRYNFTATLLPNGKVLLAGGLAGTALASAELYDPASGLFVATGAMTESRSSHTATLLPGGRVLIVGGFAGPYRTSANIYDPRTGTFTATASLTTGRSSHVAALLPNGKVLIAGGNGPSNTYFVSAEVYDSGEDFNTARRPIITSLSAGIQPTQIMVDGSGFRNDSEGSSGGTASSPANYPVLRVQRVDNDQMVSLNAISWSGTSFETAFFDGLPTGQYRATITTNGVPSLQRMIAVRNPTVTLTSINPGSGSASGGQSVTITGTRLSGAVVTIDGSAVALTSSTDAALTFITPPHDPGPVIVVVSANGETATADYRYLIVAPTGVTASATSSTSVQISWSAVAGASLYDVERYDGTLYVLLGQTENTSFTDLGAAPQTSYLYRVVANHEQGDWAMSAPDLATTVMFTDDPVVPDVTPIRGVHVDELRIAVNAVRTLAQLAGSNFTDPMITPGSTPVKAVHFSELRSSIDAARSALGLAGLIYGDSIAPGSIIYAPHINVLRNGVR